MRATEFITEDDSLISANTVEQMQKAYDFISSKVIMGILQASNEKPLYKLFPEINSTFYSSDLHYPKRDKVIIRYLRDNLSKFKNLLEKDNISKNQTRALRQKFFSLMYKNHNKNAFRPMAKHFTTTSGKYWAGRILLDTFDKFVDKNSYN